MHRFYFLIYETSSMFHGRRWQNLSGSNTSMLVISVNTFLKYFSGSNWLSLAVKDEIPSLWVNATIEGDPVLLWLMSKQGIGGFEIFEWSSEEHSVQKHFSSGIAWFTISTKIFEVSVFRFFLVYDFTETFLESSVFSLCSSSGSNRSDCLSSS